MSDAVQTYYKVSLFRNNHHVRHIRLCDTASLTDQEYSMMHFLISKWAQNINRMHKKANRTVFLCTVPCYSHMHVWRLKAALVNVVVGEGLCGVGAVLVHRDGHFTLWRHSVGHSLSTWHMRHSPGPWSDPRSQHPSEPPLKRGNEPLIVPRWRTGYYL